MVAGERLEPPCGGGGGTCSPMCAPLEPKSCVQPSKPRSMSFRMASESERPSAFPHASIFARSSGDIRTPTNSSPRTLTGRPGFLEEAFVDLGIFTFNIISGPNGSSNSRPALTTATCKEVAHGYPFQ